MLELFQKLLMMREINVTEGDFRILNQRVIVTPLEVFSSLATFMVEKPDAVPVLYESIRTSFNKGWASKVQELYGFEHFDYLRWIVNLGNLSGWGKSELVEFNPEGEGIFRVYDSPIGSSFKGKSDIPVDHFWRAIAAGGTSQMLEKDIDWVETKCIAKGDSHCEFIFKPRSSFTKQEREKYADQIPLI